MILVWFVAIGLLGLSQVVKDPAVLQGLSPTWGARFLFDNGVAGYLALGGVVLAVTGAEALYADRGHFGAAPIRMGWFAVALPALMLNYLGQGVLILHDPSTAANPFYLMAPGWARIRCSSWRPRRRSSPPRRRSRARSRWRGRPSSSASSRGSRSATPRSWRARSTSRSSTGHCASASSR